jgi:hypothetical protein
MFRRQRRRADARRRLEEIRLRRQETPAALITQVNYLLKKASKKTFPKKNSTTPKQTGSNQKFRTKAV